VNAYWAGPKIVAFRRDDSGRLIRSELRSEHACFVRRSDISKEIEAQLRGSRYVVGLREEAGGWLRIRWLSREHCLRAASREGWFASRGIEVFEADVDPVRRWITDERIEIARPRRCYVDLEADSRVPFTRMHEMRILCWSLVSDDGSVRRVEMLREDTDQAEREMLLALWKALEDYDQVASWNGDYFDFPLIAARSERCGIAVEARRLLWIDHLAVFQRLNMSASESGDEKQSMSLGAVAKAVLGADEAKLVDLGDVGGLTTWAMYAAGGTERERLGAYCLDDSDKMRRIEERTGYLELQQTLSEATFVFPDSRGIQPTQQVEGFMLRLGSQRGVRFPTHHYGANDEHEQFKGAFRMEPTRKGVLEHVHVGDFERLYPSIIISWNMSQETWQRDVRLIESGAGRPSYLAHKPLERYPIPEGCCASTTDQVFANEPQGVLPAAVSEMLRLRIEWDEKKKKSPPGTPEWQEAARRSAAYKIAANSFYGVVGSPFSRFFEREIAEAVTQCGVWLIQETIRAAESSRWGMKVIYGDTDSLFIAGCTKERFEQFKDWCNAELYPQLLAEKKASRNTIRLGYEKEFRRLVIVGKTRYFGSYVHFKGKAAAADSKPEIKGLEFKRGDAARLARKLQEELVHRVLGCGCEPSTEVEVFEQHLNEWKQRVLEGDLALSDFVQSKRVAKNLREYVRKTKKDGEQSALPPHVEIALELQRRGKDVRPGVKIEYFVVDGSTAPLKYLPAEDYAGQVDRFYLWEDVIYPPTQRVLEATFPAADWKRWARVRPAKLRGREAREHVLPGVELGPKPAASLAPAARPAPKAPARGSDNSGQGSLF
jgi:DNA polymerase elongation subunit (family B)